MRILLISDTHCEMGLPFPKIESELLSSLDLLVLAGDIGDPYITKEEIKNLPCDVAYLMGNHELYGYDYESVKSEAFTNKDSCYDNHTLSINERNVHLTTLWTYLNPLQEMYYLSDINDCNHIKHWTPSKQNAKNKENREWLFDVVKEGDIIFSHHSPSYSSVTDRYKGNHLNAVFHNDLDSFIKDRKPALWGHGHIHQHVDYMIGNTRIIANPTGCMGSERSQYDLKKGIIEIE